MSNAPPTLPQTAGRIVDEFLRLVMIPDPDAARRYTAPGLRIRFTGNRPMNDPADTTAFNKARYRWVKKRIERTETVARAAGANGEAGDVVYSLGTNEKDDGGRSTFDVSRLVMFKDDDLAWREDR